MIDVALPIKPSRCKLVVHIHEPAKDVECPILQEPICDAVLDWMPRPYDADKPTHKAITTPCGHTFHCMALMYHWARNQNLLCPVCRNGPKNAQLVMSKLPRNWRYSISTRVRRERRRDREEKEEADRLVARSFVDSPMPSVLFSFKIRIESNISTYWLVQTIPMAVMDYVIFDVPEFELGIIPFTPTTKIRMLSLLYTSSGLTTLYPPSDWFQAGEDPGHNFNVHWNENGFQHIHFRMHDQQFSQMIQFALFP